MNGHVDQDVGTTERLLYWGSGSAPSWRVLAMLREKNLDFQSRMIEFDTGTPSLTDGHRAHRLCAACIHGYWKRLAFDRALMPDETGEHKSENIMALNPRGQVPILKDGDAVLTESLAVLLYLEQQYAKPSLMPEPVTPRVLQLALESNNLHQQLLSVLLTKAEDPTFSQVPTKLKQELKLWEDHLGSGRYLCGDDFTLADIAVGPLLLSLERQKAAFERFPKLAAYIGVLKKQIVPA
ncbi:hypothetical protein WJX73_007404 [Symbiochloris irregularis]|uniref:Glutathione S-transferase n=1 Tax=Symbiochloris irregularis TaxID=706552 RepID=A0AAW1NJ59_9CHLO